MRYETVEKNIILCYIINWLITVSPTVTGNLFKD